MNKALNYEFEHAAYDHNDSAGAFFYGLGGLIAVVLVPLAAIVQLCG